MRARLIHHGDLLKIVDLLRQDHEVVAPFRGRGRDTYFDVVTDTNRDQIQIHLPNPYYPPKRYVLPHIQRLLRISTGPNASVETIHDEKKRAIFGIRSCDVAGIFHTDRFYLGNAFKDNYYESYRKNLFLVNVVCTNPELDIDTDCFCVCLDLGQGEFLAIAGSARGEALFSQPFFTKATPEHIERRRTILSNVRKLFKTTTSWYSAAIRYITRGGIKDDTWKLVGDRCLECGGCSYVCPACTCFTVSEKKTGPNQVERVRMWDACALSGFTRMAGGHNPRQAVHDRRNRRFFRKLAHYFIQRELSMACVGCGRCVSVCHGDVGMPSVVEIIRRLTAGKAETK